MFHHFKNGHDLPPDLSVVFLMMIPCRNISYVLNVDHSMFLMLIIPFIPLSGFIPFREAFFSGWWFGCHEFYVPFFIGNVTGCQLTKSYLFQRGGPTTNQICLPFGKPTWLWKINIVAVNDKRKR